MSRFRIPILMFVSLAIGASATYFYFSYTRNKFNADWQLLSFGSSADGITYNSVALLESDIPLPDIKGLKGRAKFLAESKTGIDLQFGYFITVLIDNLDVSKVSAKYREQRVDKYRSGDVTAMPIEQVVYEVHFDFTLKDKDGFDLLSLTSQPHDIYSGQENKFQATIEKRIPINIANRTNGVVFNISVDKCVTCR